MATINSHRKRQVYHQAIARHARYYYMSTAAPAGAATMMPSKETRADTYYAVRRYFADPDQMTKETFVGRTLVRKSSYDRSTQTYSHQDIIHTHPSGMVNPDSENGSYFIRSYSRNNNTPPVYMADQTGVGNMLSYSRANTGILNNTGMNYKTNRTTGNYTKVMDVAGHLGGNIKSRASTLKWVGGMWRAK